MKSITAAVAASLVLAVSGTAANAQAQASKARVVALANAGGDTPMRSSRLPNSASPRAARR
jgi:hypothetical protein